MGACLSAPAFLLACALGAGSKVLLLLRAWLCQPPAPARARPAASAMQLRQQPAAQLHRLVHASTAARALACEPARRLLHSCCTRACLVRSAQSSAIAASAGKAAAPAVQPSGWMGSRAQAAVLVPPARVWRRLCCVSGARPARATALCRRAQPSWCYTSNWVELYEQSIGIHSLRGCRGDGAQPAILAALWYALCSGCTKAQTRCDLCLDLLCQQTAGNTVCQVILKRI